MADGGDSAEPVRDDLLDHRLNARSSAELERLAYRRPSSADEQRAAADAALELARRRVAERHALAAGQSTSPAALPTAEPTAELTVTPATERTAAAAASLPWVTEGRFGARHSWWRRRETIVLLTAVSVAAIIVPVITDALTPRASIEVFVRAATDTELSLLPALEQRDATVTLGPRILQQATQPAVPGEADGVPVEPGAEVDSGSGPRTGPATEIVMLGYLARLDEPGRLSVDLVCIVAADAASLGDLLRAPVLGDGECVPRATFDDIGLESAVDGTEHRYSVAWGPVGAVRIQQIGTAVSAPAATGPRFIDLLSVPLDAAAADAAEAVARIIDPARTIITDGPVPISSSASRTVHLYRANPDDIADGQRACLVAVGAEAVTDSICAAETLVARAGLVLQYVDGTDLITVTVGSTGAIFTEQSPVG